MTKIRALIMAAIGVASIPLGSYGHDGRRFEVIVIESQLTVHGYNNGVGDQGGSPRSYYNALHDHWRNFAGPTVAATASLPGFDVYSPEDSVGGAGSAETLQGAGLTLTLQRSLKWENPPLQEPFGLPEFVELMPGEVITIGNTADFVDTDNPGQLSLVSNISANGETDLDLDYTIASEPSAVLYALQWVLSTTKDGIADSANIFTVLSPDSVETNGLLLQSLHIERYLSAPIIPGDFDRDGMVNRRDYTVWKESFGHAPPFAGAGADADQDGVVGAADFAVWRDNAGRSIWLESSVPVPEPHSATLVLVALALATPLSLRTTVSGGIRLVT